MPAVFLLEVLLVAGVVGAVALVAAGRGAPLQPAPPDRPPLALPADRPLVPADLAALRFAVALRGYRMDQVDAVLDRLAAELRDREDRIAALQARLADPPSPPSRPADWPHD